MIENNYSEVKQEIIDKTIAIFKILFENNNNNKQSKHQFSTYRNGEEALDALYTMYIEELINYEKLGYFLEILCKQDKSNQVLQDLKEDVIKLLKNLETADNQQWSQAPPPVNSRYMIEDVYDNQNNSEPTFNHRENSNQSGTTQKNSSPPFSHRENSNQSSNRTKEFTFNQCVGALMFLAGCTLIFGRCLITSLRWMF